jgi:hypothetical protein
VGWGQAKSAAGKRREEGRAKIRRVEIVKKSVILGGVLSPAVCAAQQPTFPSGVELVRLDVVVVDSDGRPVPGLRADELEVKGNGRLREILSFEPIVVAAPRPLPVAVPQVHDPREGRCVLIFFDDVQSAARTARERSTSRSKRVAAPRSRTTRPARSNASSTNRRPTSRSSPRRALATAGRGSSTRPRSSGVGTPGPWSSSGAGA